MFSVQRTSNKSQKKFQESIKKKKTRSIVSIEKVPDIVKCHYEDDYDINNLHEIILTKLTGESKSLNDYKEKLTGQINNLTVKRYINDHRETIREINNLQDKIFIIETNSKYRNYIRRVEKLLNDYNTGYNKLITIQRYIDVASEYIDIDIIRLKKKENDDKCTGCGCSIKNNYFANVVGVQKCGRCGNELVLAVTSSKSNASNNNNNNNNSQGGELENLNNYLKSWHRKQCIHQIAIPDKMFPDLDNYLIGIDGDNRRTGAVMRKKAPDRYGKKEGTDLKLLIMILEKTGYSEFYENVDQIGHLYWGWKPFDFSAYEDLFIQRYKRTQVGFDMMPDKGRVSNINIEYRCYKDAEGLGLPVRPCDFKLPEDISGIEKIYRFMCENSGDPDIRFIPTIL